MNIGCLAILAVLGGLTGSARGAGPGGVWARRKARASATGVWCQCWLHCCAATFNVMPPPATRHCAVIPPLSRHPFHRNPASQRLVEFEVAQNATFEALGGHLLPSWGLLRKLCPVVSAVFHVVVRFWRQHCAQARVVSSVPNPVEEIRCAVAVIDGA